MGGGSGTSQHGVPDVLGYPTFWESLTQHCGEALPVEENPKAEDQEEDAQELQGPGGVRVRKRGIPSAHKHWEIVGRPQVPPSCMSRISPPLPKSPPSSTHEEEEVEEEDEALGAAEAAFGAHACTGVTDRRGQSPPQARTAPRGPRFPPRTCGRSSRPVRRRRLGARRRRRGGGPGSPRGRSPGTPTDNGGGDPRCDP